MHESWDSLESYVLGRSTDDVLVRIEEHLLVCAFCREILVHVESYVALLRRGLVKAQGVLEIHKLAAGVVVLRVYEEGDRWVARLQGDEVDTGTIVNDQREAIRTCRSKFAEMFPEHACSESCRTTTSSPGG